VEVQVRQGTDSAPDRLEFELVLGDLDGQKLIVLSQKDSAELKWIATTIRRALGIPDSAETAPPTR
jgi:hypothetical protein